MIRNEVDYVGKLIVAGGRYATVTEVTIWGPGTHSASPIRDSVAAVEYATEAGSRWFGQGDGMPMVYITEPDQLDLESINSTATTAEVTP